MEIRNLSLPELKKALDNKKVSSSEVVDLYIKRIEKYNPQINAYLHVAAESAVKEAKRYDELRAAGADVPPCAGIPVALKDLILTKDMPTTCASKMLEGYYSPFDATIVANMKNAGYIILGKLNMDQFAMGSSGETSYFQKTANPWDITKVPGGSSSGSAAAMSARLAAVTIGSDTGGSIRQPSGFCGVNGFKPTYGRVSRNGAVSYASSLDQLGPIGKSVEDIAFIMDVLALHDPLDSTSSADAPPSYSENLIADAKGLKLGLPKCFIAEDLTPDVKKAIFNALDMYKSIGAEIVDIDMPFIDIGIPVYQMIANAEASSNLAKFDGVEFGYRADTGDLNDLYSISRSDALGAEVKKRIILGTYILQKEQYQDFYMQSMKIRRFIRRDYDNAFRQCDLIVGPTSSTTAFNFGGKSRTPMEMYLNDLYTISLNLNGSCGITIPCGFDSKGLPVGLQLQGNMFAEQKVLNAAYAFQKATDWHARIPAMAAK
ncbi:MAG: Asp-tRNA(Asn)/Glu-tRNA(Gln) amidotransferase subunit GatA [Deferribacteraceae bacterium]|jgi:aspartyl-tRNA(Asn)/glutamyl-tRNA(Gln) amidotransferase subunit A|nr:Asp-tRNA(Asn)/Glu-tRNA(Gln) amidotransferase subunit GatA [Deferribacteraceae bacterium]